MDKELEDELNWYAEDPLPVQPKQRLSGVRSKTPKSEGSKSKSKTEHEDDDIIETKKSRSEDTSSKHQTIIHSNPTELLHNPAKSSIEKLNLLDERDKLLRIALDKEKSSTKSQLAKGFCPDMCPEKERILRDVRGIVASHEAYPDSNIMDYSRAVKEYARSSADQEEPLPHELRPVPVLRMTMDYLITKIMCKIDDNESENKGNWYDFCWGRLRAIRKDIIQQQLCDINTVNIVEECARFHICCFDRLHDSPKSVFDDKINSETLMNCLKSLMYMYEDLRKQGKHCPNEAEFRAYMVLLKLHSGFLLSEYQRFPMELQISPQVKEVVGIHTAYSNNMYSTFYMYMKKTTYLNACLMQRLFGHLRTRALEIIVKSHCPPNKNIKLSVAYVAQIMKFDHLSDCVRFCSDFGLSLDSEGTTFTTSRNDFFFPETMYNEVESSSLVVVKRIPVAQTVWGRNDLPKVLHHEVHSSFDENHYLKSSSIDASDQEEKMLRDNVERTLNVNKQAKVEVDADICLSPEPVEEVLSSSPSVMSDDDISNTSEDDMSAELVYADEDEKADSTGMEIVDSDLDDDLSESSDNSTPSDDAKLSDGDSCTSSDDVDSTPPNEPISPVPVISDTHTTSTSKSVFEIESEPKKSPFFTFTNVEPSVEPSQKINEPFTFLSASKSPEVLVSPEKPSKKLKPDICKMTQKSKMEMENNILMAKLRKKLGEKMKHVAAKKYAKIWKAKVDKIRLNRKNQCLSICHITVEDYLKLWGCTQNKYNGRTQDRLNKRKKTHLLVAALLHLNIIDQLDNEVKEIGNKIANILGSVSVKWANYYGNISQPQPVFWKLVLSLPKRIDESLVFRNKLQYWCRTAFHGVISPTSEVCYWRTASGVSVFIHPVITEGLSEIEEKGQNLSAVILIRAKGWESVGDTESRLKSAISVAHGSTALSILTLGSTDVEPLVIEKNEKEKCRFIEQAWWNDTNVFASSLLKLAQNHFMENLKVHSLGQLVEITIEKFLDTLHQDQYLNEELNEWTTDVNRIIVLYNRLIGKLENEISLCCFYNYYGLACELEPLIKSRKYSRDIFPANYENTSDFKSALHSHMKGLQLEILNLDIKDSIELVSELKKYCEKMQYPHLLSKLVRIINPPDSDSGDDLNLYLKNVSWLPIVEMLAKARVKKDTYTFRVVARDDKISELILSHWWLSDR